MWYDVATSANNPEAPEKWSMGDSRRPVTCPPMARVFSGIKPTGEMQLGNYLGAVRRWVDTQPPAGSPEALDHHAIFCVVDLHAMTMPWDPGELNASTRRLATLLAAAGLGGDRSLLFVQSHVRAHAELTWLLNCIASFGELRRMTQFKDKSAKEGEAGVESASVGLFDYPVLMVSDILLYDTAEVPVGDDQRQHVELARDIAIRFNARFGDTFVVPKATFPTVGARVMDLQHPDRKMSKSDDSPQGTILVLDPPKTIEKKIKSAVTDSGSEVRHDRETKPGVANLIEIYSAVTGRSITDIEREFDGKQYGVFKMAVAEAVVEYLRPVQERFQELIADPGEIDRRLAVGADAAEAIAEPVLARASRAAGLLPRPRS
jgi:tryptophanyl-tRNA synthetase